MTSRGISKKELGNGARFGDQAVGSDAWRLMSYGFAHDSEHAPCGTFP
jgi:hypothetical protein